MDPISDLLTRIRNGSSAGQEKVDIPHSRMKEGVVEVLKQRGLITNYRVVRDNKQGMMRVYLKYDQLRKPVLSGLKRESRPGLRRYVNVDDIPAIRSGFGMTILSTSKGIMSGDDAKQQNVGGEYLCSIW